MRQFFAFLICIVLTTSALWAQEDDRGFLTRTIEDALSGGGRDVRIEGFAGALSSEASFDRMTIADEDGIWLTLDDVKLIWSRTALLRGRLQVDRLSAERLDLPRLPKTEESEELPTAEAAPFALPDLPVSINIDTFEVAQIALGEPILGQKAELQIKASARLDDEGAMIDLIADRLDGITGRFNIKGSFARETSDIAVDIALQESAGGVVGGLMNLPGQPSVDLSILGEGPLDDFTADITLATDERERLTGEIILTAQSEGGTPDAPARRIQAEIGGDITALVAPDYRDFFGTDVGLTIDTVLEARGAVDVRSFALRSEAAQLAGEIRLNSEKWPSFIKIDGQIGKGGAPVLLPGSGGGTTVEDIQLSVFYDAEDGEQLRGAFDITNLVRDDITIAQTDIGLDGTLQGEPGSVGQLLSDLTVAAQGVELADANVAQALGRDITGSANINYIEGQPIRISDLVFGGEDYGLQGQIIIRGLEGGFPTRLNLRVAAQDLSRFAALAGQPLAGAADLSVVGTITPLEGSFDLEIEGNTDDLAIDIEQADAVLAGRTELSLAARRDSTGTFVKDLILKNAAIDLAADADLRSDQSTVTARAALQDIALVLPQYQGAVTLDATAIQDARGWQVDAVARAPYETDLRVSGLVTGPDADMNIQLAMPDVNPFVDAINGPLSADARVWQSPQGYRVDVTADGPYASALAVDGLVTGPDADMQISINMPDVAPLAPGVSGPFDAGGRVWQSPQGYQVDLAIAGPYKSDVTVKGLATGPEADVSFSAGLPNVNVFVPEINGPFSIAGRAARETQGWRIDTKATGPAGTNADIAGLVAQDGTLNLVVNGAAPLGLSGPFLAPRSLTGQVRFDLALDGPPALSSVRGQIVTENARFSAPNLRVALENLGAEIALNNGSARIDMRSRFTTGGRLEANGTIGLASPLPADLRVSLINAVLTDPRLFSTILNGQIDLRGPMSGGARITGNINVGETLVSVPSSGLTSIGDIPAITHIGAPAAVTRTRVRADVIERDNPGSDNRTSAGGGYGLGLVINAPSRIFVRGRGVDAELGGSLEITGTTARVISSGQFELVRGRLDILSKRFDLDEGTVQFLGGLSPYIRFVTTSSIPDGTASIILEGPTSSPTVSFQSDPEGPEDEVLSQLLFGRDLSEISAFQALQLANAVAVLAGRSGSGVIGSLRDGFGLDDFDVTTNDDGETEISAGKYISENVYTDVTTSAGETEFSLNLDLTDSLKARGSVGNDGNTGVGIFFERDY